MITISFLVILITSSFLEAGTGIDCVQRPLSICRFLSSFVTIVIRQETLRPKREREREEREERERERKKNLLSVNKKILYIGRRRPH